MPQRGAFEDELEQQQPVTALDPSPHDGVERDESDDVQGLIQRMIEEARQHYEEHIEPKQTEATDYYKGRPFGDEEDGRSKVVSTDLRDAVLSVMPSLLRIFFGIEHPVEFRPRGAEDIPIAQQQTDYISYIVREENDGFLQFLSWFKDSLIREIGYVKWWWEDKTTISEESYTGVDDQDLIVLAADPDVDIIVDSLVTQEGETDPETGEQSTLYNVRIRRYDRDGYARFSTVPSEELVWSPQARSWDVAPLVAHVRDVPAGDLIAMGIDRDMVEDARGKMPRQTAGAGAERLDEARRFDRASRRSFGREDVQDESMRPVTFAEAYARVDADGDGIPELRMFQCVGPSYEIANRDGEGNLGEVVPELPFAAITPDPEPHTIIGLGFHTLLRDIQLVKSQVLRGMLNSLSLAIEPQAEVLSGAVNMQDILNPEIAGIVRVRTPNAYREIKHTFVGPDTLPVLEYYDQITENRVGRHRGAMGLDADTLQSSTKAAVAATLSAAQQRVEMIARIFAETGVKQLFLGLLRLVIRNQNRARVVRLRGSYVDIDPRAWQAPMDMSVNVALGAGTTEDKLRFLGMISQKQEQLLGMGSPLVSNIEYRNTLARFTELANAGWHAEEFFRPWGPEEEEQMQQQLAAQPPPPDPAQMLIEMEQMKLQMQALKDSQQAQLKEFEIRQKDDLERDKLARETVLKEHELEVKYGVAIADSQLRAQVAHERTVIDADTKRQTATPPRQGA
jgi:hypothetical protein